MKVKQLFNTMSPITRKKWFKWFRLFMFMVAALTIGAIVVDYGFDLYPNEQAWVELIYQYAWWMYSLSYVGNYTHYPLGHPTYSHWHQ